jgi:hypothetical protein
MFPHEDTVYVVRELTRQEQLRHATQQRIAAHATAAGTRAHRAATGQWHLGAALVALGQRLQGAHRVATGHGRIVPTGPGQMSFK